MEYRRSEYQSNHHHHNPRIETVEDYQVVDIMPQRRITTESPPYPGVYNYAPPYPEVYTTSYGDRRMEPHKKVVVEVERTTEYVNDGGYKVYRDDVDAEADEFIRYERKKCQMGNGRSVNGY